MKGLYDSRFEHDSCGVGFVCDIKGRISHAIIQQGLEVLRRLSHRGATGADPNTGDGAGILIQIPHEFFAQVCAKEKIDLPEQGAYGTGLVFLPPDPKERQFCKEVFLRIISREKQKFLGWRQVPLDVSDIGLTAKNTAPVIEQVFIAKNKRLKEQLALRLRSGLIPSEVEGLGFERNLYLIRKQVENIVRNSSLKEKSFFYITNLSSRTFCYKGLLMPKQLENFFLDLKEESLKSAPDAGRSCLKPHRRICRR